MIADAEPVTDVVDLPLNEASSVHDTVRTAHVYHVVAAVDVLHHGMLPRHVRVLDGQVARLFTSTNDVAFLVDRVALTAVVDVHLTLGRNRTVARNRALSRHGSMAWHRVARH